MRESYNYRGWDVEEVCGTGGRRKAFLVSPYPIDGTTFIERLVNGVAWKADPNSPYEASSGKSTVRVIGPAVFVLKTLKEDLHDDLNEITFAAAQSKMPDMEGGF